MFDNVFNGMFGKIGAGMCRLTMSGGIAVKTSNGYKSYNLKQNRLTNCDGFVFPEADEFFFCLPTNKVSKGDIVLINNKPKCVIGTDKDTITVVNYEDGTVDTVLPERHMFLGETYFYGKIVSMFGMGAGDAGKGKNGIMKIMKYKMMMDMFKGNGSNNNLSLPMLIFMSGGNNFNDIFDGMFDFDETAEELADTTKKILNEDIETTSKDGE